MSAFLLKKVVGKLLMPMPFAALLMIVAGVLYAYKRKSLAKLLLVVSISSVFFLSLPAVAYWVISPLEKQYPQYNNQPVVYVVVHGGYHKSDSNQPITSLLSRESMVRLTEGIRIYRLNPGAKLLLSGYHSNDELSHAEAMASVAVAFGIPSHDIILEPNAKDTEQEARAWVKVTDGRPFAIVTTAMHMPRTVFWYNAFGASPITAPTAFETRGSGEVDWWSLTPSAQSLATVEYAWYEYLGLIWAHLKQ